MKINKIKNHIKSIFYLFLLLILSSCAPLITGDNLESNDVAVGEEKIKINIALSGLENIHNESRTIMPVTEDGSTVEKFELVGNRKKDSKGNSLPTENKILGTWTNKTAMLSDVLELQPGTWDFVLMAYKSEDGMSKSFYSASQNDKVLSYTASGAAPSSLHFQMKHMENLGSLTLGKGSINIPVNVPKGKLNHANVELYYYDESSSKQNIPLAASRYTASSGAVYDSFTVSQSGIPNGFYFLQILFYTDSSNVPTRSVVEGVRISGGLTSSKTLIYDNLNNEYKVTYHSQLEETEIHYTPADFSFNDSVSVTLPDNTTVVAAHYNFEGWYESSDYSGSPVTGWAIGEKSGSVDLYAKWARKEYPINYYDYAAGQAAGKTYSGTAMAATLKYKETLTEPSYDVANGILTDGNEVIFAGWYTDKDCTEANKVTACDGSFTDLYAKWNYKYVYLDPSETLTTGYDPLLGDDANRGYLPTEPLYTMEAAKLYMKGNNIGEKVYLMSRLSIAEEGTPAASGVNAHLSKNNPSELTTPVYNNAILQRYNTYNAIHDSIVRIDGGDIVISNVTIDGGAVWGASGPAGVNSGIKADYAAIDDYGLYNCTLLLTGNVIVQNNDTSESLSSILQVGGGVRTSTKTLLTIDSKNVIIKNNRAKFGAGICLYGSSSASRVIDILTLSKGIVENNYATNDGAGIGIYYFGSYNANRDKMTVHIGSAAGSPDGSDVVIRNNVAAGNGGGIFVTYYTDVHINNVQITENSSVYGAGIYAEAVTETGYTPSVIEVNNAFIEYNEASANGGGVCVEYSSDGCAKYTQNAGSLSYNKASSGGALVSNATEGKVPELSNIKIIENEATISGGAIYVKTGRFVQLENAEVTGNVCSASGEGAGIYSEGTIKLGGSIDISGNHKNGSAAESNIFINNYSAARYIKLISAVTPYTGNSKVATLDMTATKYPAQAYDASDSSTYTKILSEDAAGFISSSYNLFTVEKAGYEINNLGRIIKSNTTPENYNGTLSYTEDNITISLSAVDVYSAQDNLIYIKAFADKGLATETELTSSVLATNWDIRVYSTGTNVSSNATYFEITNTPIAHSVKVKSGIPAGTPLQIYVSFDYNGKTYGGSFDLNVKEVITVDAAGFAALYSSLPATGTYTIKITGNSLSGIKSNLVNGSRYINLDLSEVSPSAFVDEVLRGSIVIKSLKLPEGLTSLPRSAFSGCSGLETVELPSTLTTIGETAFANCGSLSSITIPQSLTTIGKESFKNCTSLTTITIPSDVSSIGLGAFLDCTNLTSIVFSDSTSLWDGYYSTGTIFVSGQRFNNPTQNATVLISNADKYFVKQ